MPTNTIGCVYAQRIAAYAQSCEQPRGTSRTLRSNRDQTTSDGLIYRPQIDGGVQAHLNERHGPWIHRASSGRYR